MPRLNSTRSIVSKNLMTIENLLVRTDITISNDYHKINHLRGSLKRSSRPTTFKKIQAKITDLALEMGHGVPAKHNKNYLLYKTKSYIKQNSFLRYAAIRQATINICVVYEDFVHRIIMKYFEENIHRIPSTKEIKNKDLIAAIVRGDNIHHTLAQKVTDDLMWGSVEHWNRELVKMGMVLPNVDKIKELFLIRNCMIHNNNKVSHELHQYHATKYPLRTTIRLTVSDVLTYKKDIEIYITAIISEYNRLFPTNSGSWI
jgi:hypothetical protein